MYKKLIVNRVYLMLRRFMTTVWNFTSVTLMDKQNICVIFYGNLNFGKTLFWKHEFDTWGALKIFPILFKQSVNIPINLEMSDVPSICLNVNKFSCRFLRLSSIVYFLKSERNGYYNISKLLYYDKRKNFTLLSREYFLSHSF